MCQWCGLVDPGSPLGRQQAKGAGRRDTWVAVLVGAVLIVAVVVFFTVQMDNSEKKARNDLCEDISGPFCD